MYASKDGNNDLKSQVLCQKLVVVEPPSLTLIMHVYESLDTRHT